MSIIYVSLQFNFKLLYFCFLSSFSIFLWTKFCDLLFYFLFFNFLSSFSLEKDHTHYKILFCCMDTIRAVILGYLFILNGHIRETWLSPIPFVSIYPSIVSFCFFLFLCVSIMLKMDKRVTIYMLLWTHQVQTLKELDFFLHIPYIILIPLIIFHVIIILLVFSNGDLFFIYSVCRRNY